MLLFMSGANHINGNYFMPKKTLLDKQTFEINY